ncbi:PglL family O-oligosaccharyltransferase [Polaromonas sp. SM01]|uniref:PglL family O-oligosaccharyltransferase n=1 Tax=Polaromonas sp. SM01 TaxID=3085630 RepID=UPI002981CE41|nr:Wzy polymerase domain-containing protein [Polaromonas sp. SM01]MDW5441076.1 Wzy polymerase domain-containing protein [Polaromonas sp. SM01]
MSAVLGLLQYLGLEQALSPWVSQTLPGEAFANLRQRNQFATLTSIGLVALIALAGWSTRAAPAARLPGGWFSVVAVLLALGNASSGSRTGLLQWLLIPLLTAWWTLPGRRHLLVLALQALQALLAYAIAVLSLPWLLELVSGTRSGGLFGRLTEAPTCESRKILWSNVLTLITQKPWLGWGWGELDYAHFITVYQGPRFCAMLDNAHNLPLQLAVELGLPAAVALCGGAGWLVWRAQPWREADGGRQMAWGVLAVIGLHSLLEYPLWYGPFQLAVGLCLWLLWPSSQKFKENRPLAQYLQALIAVILIATLACLAVSYYRVSQIYLPPEARSAAYHADTLAKIQGSWLFQDQVRFAELSITTLKPENAQAMHAMALELLHYSPEPRVVEKLIESAVMLGRDEEAAQYLARFRAAYPEAHARWRQAHAAP